MTAAVRMKAPVPRTSQLSSTPPHQRRQQALQSCLQACEDLGLFETEQDWQAAEACQAPQDACAYVDTSKQLAKQQAALKILQDREVYGDLLRPVQIGEKARRYASPFSVQ